MTQGVESQRVKDLAAETADEELLKRLHFLSLTVLKIASKKKVRKVPIAGVVVSDAELIRKIFMSKDDFSKKGEGASSSFWNPIIGNAGLLNMHGAEHLELKRTLASSFNSKNIHKFVNPPMQTALQKTGDALLAGETVDMVAVVSEFVYKALWSFSGIPENVIKKHYTNETIEVLRSVTHGVNIARKSLTKKHVEEAKKKLSFIDVTVQESLESAELIPDGTVMKAMLNDNYSQEDITSLMKALMIAGTETVISFIPRMIALLIDSGRMTTLTDDEVVSAVNECLRVTVPTPVAVRIATSDTTVGDIEIKKGERVILNTLFASKHYGPFNTQFPEIPRVLKGLWFGSGVHMCIGLPIATLEAETVLKTLIKLSSKNELMIESREISQKGHTGSYKTLKVRMRRK